MHNIHVHVLVVLYMYTDASKLMSYSSNFHVQFRCLVGVVTMSDLTSKLISGNVLPSDPVTKAFVKYCRKVGNQIF